MKDERKDEAILRAKLSAGGDFIDQAFKYQTWSPPGSAFFHGLQNPLFLCKK